VNLATQDGEDDDASERKNAPSGRKQVTAIHERFLSRRRVARSDPGPSATLFVVISDASRGGVSAGSRGVATGSCALIFEGRDAPGGRGEMDEEDAGTTRSGASGASRCRSFDGAVARSADTSGASGDGASGAKGQAS
jgi:hypothetical protein